MPVPKATGSHGINRPAASSRAAHSRSFAASGPASPASGMVHGATHAPGRGHVPTRPCALPCQAIRGSAW